MCAASRGAITHAASWAQAASSRSCGRPSPQRCAPSGSRAFPPAHSTPSSSPVGAPPQLCLPRLSARLGSRLGSARLGLAHPRAWRAGPRGPESLCVATGLRPTRIPLLFSVVHVRRLCRYPQLPGGLQQRAGRQRHMDRARYVQLGERHLHLLRAVDELARLLSGCQATRIPSLDADRAAAAARRAEAWERRRRGRARLGGLV